MTILPIVERELRVAARRPVTYMARMLVALSAMVVGVLVMLSNLGAPQATVGTYIFCALGIVSLLNCLLAGRASTADCLSEEKREGTLGLLFLTDLKGYDVVLGKLAATSLNGFYGLLAVFPVLAIPLLLGGVGSSQLWRLVLVLINAFFFSLAIGMFSSAICRDARRAMGINFGLLFFFAMFLPGCGALLAVHSANHTLHTQFFFTSPFYALFLCMFSSFIPAGVGPPAYEFWISLAVIHGLTWLMLFLAASIVPKSWQDRPPPAVRTYKARLRELWQIWSYGQAAQRPAFRKRLLDVNAFYWLAARAKLKPLHVWTAFVLLAVWWVWGRIAVGELWLDEGINITAAIMINTLLKLWITMESGQRLAEAQKAGALELMLSTPLTVRDIIRGQFLAVRRQFLAPVLFALLLEPCLMFISHLARQPANPQMDLVWLGLMIFLLLDIVALFWVSMARSLTAKNLNQSIIVSLFCVLLLPWMAFGLVSVLTNLWCVLTTFGSPNLPGWPYYFIWWSALSLAADIGYTLLARRQLLTRMREIAMKRYAPTSEKSRGWWHSKKQTPLSDSITPVSNPKLANAVSENSALRTPPSTFKRRLRYAVALALVLGGVFYFYPRSEPKFAPPVVVPLSLSQGLPRIFPYNNGALFLLSDGSLWSWGPAGNSPDLMPERVGTNAWKYVAPGYSGFVGLHTDGTLWEQHSSRGLRQVDASKDWLTVATTGRQSFAIKQDGTLWSWGMPLGYSRRRAGSVAINTNASSIPNPTNLVQFGKDSNWATVQCQGWGALGLKRDGTLWVWGQLPLLGGRNNAVSVSFLPSPTQFCRETNWVSFEPGWTARIQNSQGELWLPLYGAPNPEGAASANCRLLLSHAIPHKFAFAFCGQMMAYEIRANGTLWQRTFDYPGLQSSAPKTGKWEQVGKRRDWLSLSSSTSTAFGLTGDGTIWTWGVDSTLGYNHGLSTKLALLRARLKQFTTTARSATPSNLNPSPQFNKTPKPLLQLKASQP